MIGVGESKVDAATDTILETNEKELAEVVFYSLRRLGELGREGREAIVEKINADRDADVDEGLAQLADVLEATN